MIQTDNYNVETILMTFVVLFVVLQRLEIWPDCNRWISATTASMSSVQTSADSGLYGI